MEVFMEVVTIPNAPGRQGLTVALVLVIGA